MAWMMARGEAGCPVGVVATGGEGWCCGGDEHTFKVELVLGMFKMMIMFF